MVSFNSIFMLLISFRIGTAKVLQMINTHPFCPSLTTMSSSPSLVLIHLIPCSCGSIIKGQRSAFNKMVAFSVDILSLGRFSLFHLAIRALSVSKEITSKPSVIGMVTYRTEAGFDT